MHPSIVFTLIVVILHIGFFFIEAIFWTTPKVRRLFRNTKEEAETTRVIALNQGFYNLGLALVLLWFLYTGNTHAMMVVLLFLAGMGLVGGVTAFWTIILIQTLPALVAFTLLWLTSHP